MVVGGGEDGVGGVGVVLGGVVAEGFEEGFAGEVALVGAWLGRKRWYMRSVCWDSSVWDWTAEAFCEL